MFAPFPWLTLLGAGVALAVGVIAFLVASGLVDGRAGAPSRPDRGRSARRPSGIRRAS
jgi:hypothetical protein